MFCVKLLKKKYIVNLCDTHLNHNPNARMPFALLQSNAKPFVLLTDLRSPLSWNKGFFLTTRLRASHVLVTSHSIAYFTNDAVNDLSSRGWETFSCVQSDDSLCRHSEHLDFFNSKTVQEPYIYDSVLKRDYAVGMDVCTKNSGRQLVNASLYTVSMCDLIDARAQFVLVEHKDKRNIFYRSDSTSLVEYALLGIACFYAVATLAKHAVMLIKVDENTEKNTTKDGVTKVFIVQVLQKYIRISLLHIAVSVYVVVLVVTDMQSVATRSELYLAWYFVVYVSWDCVYCVYRLWSHAQDQLKQINFMVVLLMLCCLRLYHTFQNVFHMVFTVIFSIRTCCKVVLVMAGNADSHESTRKMVMNNVSVMYDVVTLYLTLLCMNHTKDNVFYSQLDNSSVLLVGVSLGSIVALMHRCRRSASRTVDVHK
jgi:hypothetical protein